MCPFSFIIRRRSATIQNQRVQRQIHTLTAKCLSCNVCFPGDFCFELMPRIAAKITKKFSTAIKLPKLIRPTVSEIFIVHLEPLP